MTSPDLDDSSSDPLQSWIDAGLFEPTSDDSGPRREVLEWLESIGFGPESFAGLSVEELPVELNRRILQPGPRLTKDEVRQVAAFDGTRFDEILRAGGYPSGYEFTSDDVATFDAFAIAEQVFSDEELLHFIRVLSGSMGRVADAATALFRIDVSPELEDRDAGELEWAVRNYEATQLLEPLMMTARTFLLRELGLSSARNDQARMLISGTENISTLQLAVGFVDIVGYTSMAGEMSPDDLGSFVRNFEAQAHDVVTDNGGRVVKLIGDEVMFVNLSPTDACRTALALIEAFDGEEATPRGGIATGEVVARGGDYYGTVVNLAARVAALAVTGEVLVDEATAEESAGIAFESAGRRMLKGFPDPVPLLSITP